MKLSRALSILGKDLKMGPRSPMVLYAIVFPVIATVVIQLALGGLFDRPPRLGVVDEGSSRITSRADNIDGLDVTVLQSESRLKEQIEANDLDAGMVLKRGFDDELKSGENPKLELYYGGESLAKNRELLRAATIGLVRDVVGDPALVAVDIESVGDEDYVPLSKRLIPLVIMYVVIIAGVFVPAVSLVEEKEQGTMMAVVTTPASAGEMLFAKGALAFILMFSGGVLTLVLNRVMGESPLTLALVLAIAALMSLLIGLIVGAALRETTQVFAVAKGGAILLFAPVIFYIWPNLPSWLPKLFPTYYFLEPMYQVAVRGAGLADVWPELVVALVVCALLVPVVVVLGKRMQVKTAAA